jgi:hypothetical protein
MVKKQLPSRPIGFRHSGKVRSPEGRACAKGENELGSKSPLMGRIAAARIGQLSLRPRHNCGGGLLLVLFVDAPSVRGNDGHGTVRAMRRVLIREQQDERLILSVFCFFSSTAYQISNHMQRYFKTRAVVECRVAARASSGAPSTLRRPLPGAGGAGIRGPFSWPPCWGGVRRVQWTDRVGPSASLSAVLLARSLRHTLVLDWC